MEQTQLLMNKLTKINNSLTPFRSLFSSREIRTKAVSPGPDPDPPYQFIDLFIQVKRCMYAQNTINDYHAV